MDSTAGPQLPPALLRAASAHAPGLDTAAVELIGEGIATTAFRVPSPTGAWVVRVNKTYPQPWTWHGGRRFDAPLVRALEGAGLPVAQQIAVLSADSTGLPSAFIERQVPGRPASAADLTGGLAAQLGTFLSGLHALPADWCRSIGVRPGFYLTDLQDHIRDAGARLDADDQSSADDALRELSRTRPAAVTLVHGDFRPDHWYVSDDGTLTAVIDFGDAALDDPALDVARLPTDRDLAPHLLQHYTGDQNGLLRRAALYRHLEMLTDQRSVA